MKQKWMSIVTHRGKVDVNHILRGQVEDATEMTKRMHQVCKYYPEGCPKDANSTL